MNSNKRRSHNLTDNHPFIASVFNTLVGMLVFILFGAVLESVWTYVLGLPRGCGYPNVIAALIVLFLYKRWYRPEFQGALRGGRSGLGLKLWTPVLISWLTVPVMFMVTPAQFGMPTYITIGSSLAAGFMEEAVFRSFAISTAMRNCRDEKIILKVTVISSVIFGLVHGLNGLSGADPGHTLLQIVEAGFLGLFLAALYLRCGNLWPPIIVHVLNDIIALTNVSDIAENGLITSGVTWWSFVDLITCVIIGIIGLWLIRPAKRAEIMEIFHEKWNTDQTSL